MAYKFAKMDRYSSVKAVGRYRFKRLLKPTEGLAYTLSDDGAYYSCSGIGTATETDIVIASKHKGLPVTEIGNYAFEDCANLTSVVIPDSVEVIRNSVFEGCSNLTDVILSGSLKDTGGSIFNDCDNLKYNTYDNGLYLGTANNKYYLLVKCKNDSISSVIIHEDTRFILNNAFYRCKNLASIEIPNSVETIEQGAFNGCTGLISVILSNSVKRIQANTFAACSSLTSINIPESVEIIETGAFNACPFVDFIIGESVKVIGINAFWSCRYLVSIIIPKAVTSIEKNAFLNCENLTDVYYKGTEAEWNAITIDTNTALTSATIHYNYTES